MSRRWLTLGAALALGSFAVTACGDDGGGASGSDDFCDIASDVEDLSSDLFVPNADPDDVKQVYEDFVARAEDALDAAPAEIKDELETSVAGFKQYLEVLRDNDFDLNKVAEDPDFEELNSDSELSDADEAVQEYISDECGIGDDDGDTTGETDASTDPSADANSGDAGEIAVEQLQRIFPKLDDDQARCLVENGMDIQESAADPTAFLDILDDCDINLADLQP